MQSSTKTALLAAAADAETAIQSLAVAYTAYVSAANTAAAQADANELHGINASYGLQPFVRAVQQSMGGNGLMAVLKGRPESVAGTPGNVSTIMAQRLSGF